jgi:intracellular septation protein
MRYHPGKSNFNDLMTKILEFATPIVFFVCWVMTNDIFFSTKALIAAVCLQAGVEYFLTKTLKTMTKVLLASVVIMGGLTLAFRDETFILWKPTIVNWVLAGILAGSQLLFGKSLLRSFLGKQLQLPQPAWFRLGYGWALGFFIAGSLNLVIAYQFSLDFWMKYKLFGGTFLTFTYVIMTIVYLNQIGGLTDPKKDAAE